LFAQIRRDKKRKNMVILLGEQREDHETDDPLKDETDMTENKTGQYDYHSETPVQVIPNQIIIVS